MGFTPQQVDEMSMWQFQSAAEGFTRANDPNAAKELTAAETEDLWKFVQASKH